MSLSSLYSIAYNKVKKEREIFIINHIKATPSFKILLLGAFEKTAQKILESSNIKNLYLVDIEKRINKNSQFIIKQADLNDLIPFDNNFFDVVIADQLIEHLTDPDTFLQEVYRVLKPKAKAIIGTENIAHIRNILSLALGYTPMNVDCSTKIQIGNSLLPTHKKPIKDPYLCHHKVFTPQALEELLVFNKFKIIDQKYQNIINPIVLKKYCYFMTYVLQKI